MMNRKMTLPLAAFAVSLGLLPAPVRAEDAPPLEQSLQALWEAAWR